MGIKESSDELTPAVITAKPPTRARAAHSPSDYIALVIATCGVGYMPIAPGTFGSLVGVGVYFIIQRITFGATTQARMLLNPVVSLWSVFIALELVVITFIALIGIWAATRTERLSGRKDPGKVVIDDASDQGQ